MFSVPPKAKRKRVANGLSDATATTKKRRILSSSLSTKPTSSSTPTDNDPSLASTSTSAPPASPPPTDMPDTPEPPKPSNSKKNDSKNKGKSQNVRSSSKKDKPTVPRPRPKMTKLAPPRPFPTVSLSSNATGPYSARAEGKNNICVTRRSPLGMYLRRCAALVNDDGYRTLDFYALGAAIPHLLLLTTSLPRILPFPADEIVSSIHTGTVKCVDEMLPGDDEEEEEGENTLRERDKSCLRVTMKIGDGVRVSGRKGAPIQNKAKKLQTAGTGTGKEKGKGKRAAKAALDDIPDAPDDDGMVE